MKTDALDVRKLSTMLVRYDEGERKVWSLARVPAADEEDNRHLHRELNALRVERLRSTNRIHGLLAGQGVRVEIKKDLLEQLKAIRLYNGRPLPPALHCRLGVGAGRAHRRADPGAGAGSRAAGQRVGGAGGGEGPPAAAAASDRDGPHAQAAGRSVALP